MHAFSIIPIVSPIGAGLGPFDGASVAAAAVGESGSFVAGRFVCRSGFNAFVLRDVVLCFPFLFLKRFFFASTVSKSEVATSKIKTVNIIRLSIVPDFSVVSSLLIGKIKFDILKNENL